MFQHPAPTRSPLSVFFVVSVLLLAALLRFYRIDYQSYWNDEGNSRVLASRDVPTIIRNAAADVHPPGYYLLLKFWRDLAGETELALRGLSALQGVALVVVLYRLGKDWFGVGAGVIAALFGALNPFLVYYSQEARMYAQLALCSAASFLLFARLEGRRLESRDWRLVTAYVLVTALGLYTHYAFGFVGLAQGVIAVASILRGHAARGGHLAPGGHIGPPLLASLLPPLLSLLLFAPWLPTAYRHLTGWPAAREFPPFWDALIDLTRYLAFGRTLQTPEVTLGLLAVAFLLGLALWRTLHASRFTLHALLWLLLPVALTLAFGLLTEAFSKFLLVAVPPLCLLLGLGLGGWGSEAEPQRPLLLRTTDYALRVLAFVSLLSFTYLSLSNLYFNPAYFRDDYRGIAHYIQRLQREGDAVLTIAPNQVEAFAYYYRDEARLFPLPDTRPLDVARTQAQLEAIAAGHDRLFVLYWGDQQADPEKFIESWLNANTFKAVEQWYGQVRLAVYAVAQPASAPATVTEARFGDHITLEGYALSANTFAPGDIAQLTFFWRTDAPLTERYKVFIHLYADVNAPPVAQTDSEPGGGLALTTTWQPGQTVTDNHGVHLPPDLPPGEYRLMIGLYNIENGERLPLVVGDTIGVDRFSLGDILVR